MKPAILPTFESDDEIEHTYRPSQQKLNPDNSTTAQAKSSVHLTSRTPSPVFGNDR